MIQRLHDTAPTSYMRRSYTNACPYACAHLYAHTHAYMLYAQIHVYTSRPVWTSKGTTRACTWVYLYAHTHVIRGGEWLLRTLGRVFGNQLSHDLPQILKS